VVALTLPAAVAIAVFGSLYGAGATAVPLLLTACVLNLRHLVLGAALRPRFESGSLRRALLAFFLVDETFGFAIAAGNAAQGRAVGAATERTLLFSGVTCYLAWLVGTLVGVLGGGLAVVEKLAGAIFPVLFIGLASLAVTRRSHVVRALAAAGLTAAVALAVPDLRMLAPVLAGVVVALPGGDR
jgi:predicted branched-subunit amino acid permease